MQGKALPVQIVKSAAPFYPIVQSPNDTANIFPSSRYEVRVAFNDVPAFGYRTFQVRPVKAIRFSQPKSMLTGPQTMENEYLAVTLKANGTMTVRDKLTGQTYDGLGYFRDRGEIGSPWEHTAPMEDSLYTTLNTHAEISLLQDGELETSFRVRIDWSLPEGSSEDKRSRSPHFKPYRIQHRDSEAGSPGWRCHRGGQHCRRPLPASLFPHKHRIGHCGSTGTV
jgi:hypothetical protein